MRPSIETVCLFANQELPFRGHDESSVSLSKGNSRILMKYLNVLKNQNPLLEKSYEFSHCSFLSNTNKNYVMNFAILKFK